MYYICNWFIRVKNTVFTSLVTDKDAQMDEQMERLSTLGLCLLVFPGRGIKNNRNRFVSAKRRQLTLPVLASFSEILPSTLFPRLHRASVAFPWTHRSRVSAEQEGSDTQQEQQHQHIKVQSI